MGFLVACKNEEDPIKNEGTRVVSTLLFFRRSRADNSEVSNGILSKFKLIQAFIVVLIVCKNEEDPFKIESTIEWSQHFSHYKSMFFFPNAQGQATHKSLVGSCCISNPSERRSNHNEGARVVTTLFINFSDAQGQLTPKSVMESCRNSNSSELL